MRNIYIKNQGKLLLVFRELFFYKWQERQQKKREGRKGHDRKKTGKSDYVSPVSNSREIHYYSLK